MGENFNKIKWFGFYNCEYQIIGKTIEYGEEKDYKLEPKENKENTMFNYIFKISFILIFNNFSWFWIFYKN